MDKVVCFGKNYQDHMLELGDKPVSEPVIFLKPKSVVKTCTAWNDTINAFFPEQELHYECELVLRLGAGGYKMSRDEALKSIDAYTVGLEMTLRKEQAVLKANGHPWTISKVFPDSCIIGPWIETINLDFLNTNFKFSLNNEVKQSSSGINMLFNPVDLIVYASKFFPLCKGDVLFTGTPSGVGKIAKGSSGVVAIRQHQYTVLWN